MNRRAFTLIELLVVIAIIGLLSTIAVVSLNNSRMNARNTKKVADIRTLFNAFNLAYGQGGFPDSGTGYFGGWVCVSSTACTGNWVTILPYNPLNTILIPAYIGALPPVPQNLGTTLDGYIYNSHWSGGPAPFDSYNFPGGVYLAYFLESAAPCNLGRIWLRDSTGTECLLQLN